VGVAFRANGFPKLVLICGNYYTDTAALFAASTAYSVADATGLAETLAGVLLVAGDYTVVVTSLLLSTTVGVSSGRRCGRPCLARLAGRWRI
jgi:hypothetical protein